MGPQSSATSNAAGEAGVAANAIGRA